MPFLSHRLRLCGLLALCGFGSCAGPSSGVFYRDRVFQTEARRGFHVVRGEVARRGSAFAFGVHGHLLTCAHNLFEGVGSRIELRSCGRVVPATVVAIHPDHDVALLRAEAPLGSPPLALAELPPERDEALFAVGFPRASSGAADARVSAGRANDSARGAMLEVRGETRWYRDLLETGALIAEGWSGGPVVDASGRVVGMLVLAEGRRGTSGSGYALRLAALRDVLSDWIEAGELEGELE